VILNNVSGEALLSARVIDNAGGTGVAGRDAQVQISSERTRIALGDLEFERGHEYYVELYQLAGSGITANASVIANEQWDDPLPQAVDGKYDHTSYYRNLTSNNEGQRQPYNEETPERPGAPGKRPAMLNGPDEVVQGLLHIASSTGWPQRARSVMLNGLPSLWLEDEHGTGTAIQ